MTDVHRKSKGQDKMKIKLLIVALAVTLTKAGEDPCNDYMEEQNYQRSVGFKKEEGDLNPICDRPFAQTWYRFTSGAGGQMPTTAPAIRSCGTSYPVWMNGDHPTNVGEEVTVNACVVVGDKTCASTWPIKVRKCLRKQQAFFVYYLKNTPGCPMRYCAGKESKCEDDETSATGFTPGCTSKFPKLKKDPVVTVGVADGRIRFKCDFDPAEGDNARYEVVWFQGPPEKQIKGPQVLPEGQTHAFLQNTNSYGENPTFCLGYNIYCKVRTFYDEQGSPKSPYRKSNEFFAGLQVTPKTIDLSEKDKPKNVTVTSTVPIICQDGTENCQILVELGQTKTDNFIDYCTLKFKPGPAGQTKTIEVVAKRDFVDDGQQKMFLKLFIPDHIDPVDWNCHKKITDVQIITQSVKAGRCTSTGDPHITTFDGLYYNHFQAGEYVLMKSSARNFEVQVRTYRCHTVACNCAVAAREGDDVIVVDMCRDNIPRARFASTVEPQKGTTFTRNNNGKTFKIEFPSGAYVQFHAQKWFGRWYYANIIVQASSDDYGSTQGLCGTFDGNKDNDMRDRTGGIHKNQRRSAPPGFTENWKVSVADSLFHYKGETKRKCNAERAKTYCTCSESCCGAKRKVNCDFEGYAQRPKYTQGVFGWKKLEFPGAEHCGRRKKRAIDDDVIVLPDDGDTAVYDWTPKDEAGSLPTFPTKSGITEQQAKDTCKKRIRGSAAGKACLDLLGAGFSTDAMEDQCVVDTQVSDDFRIGVASGIDTLVSECEERALRDLTFWKSSADNTTAPPVSIGDNICPNECSGRGTCSNGKCVCQGDSITEDCSVKKDEAPILFGLRNFGLCDIRRQDCVRTRVIGENFIDSPKLTCQTNKLKISDKKIERLNQLSTSRAQLLSFGEISCPLPDVPVDVRYDTDVSGQPVGGFAIKVANDGVHFDNDTVFIVYDSKCMQCEEDGDRKCTWKANTCKINNYCFTDGDANPLDWCQMCDPAKTTTGFVKRTVNDPPTFTNPGKQFAFKGQQWSFEIPAADPEKQPLRYEFQGNDHGMQISSHGILTWTPKSLDNFTFEVKAVDPCGKSATQTFHVETRVCRCEGRNGGVCIWEGGVQGATDQCQCPTGCKGDNCTEPVDGRVCKIKEDKTIDDKDDGLSGGSIAAPVCFSLLFVCLFFTWC